MITVSDIGGWLERMFLAWQVREGKRRSMTAFAEYLNKSQSYINMVMNGKRSPSIDVAREWAEITGDFEILDIMGLARLDPQLAELQARYDAAVKAGADVGDLLDVIDNWLMEQGAERLD
ncbi:helix-turn-helix domain-containing protein [Chloroflexota bacterium]